MNSVLRNAVNPGVRVKPNVFACLLPHSAVTVTLITARVSGGRRLVHFGRHGRNESVPIKTEVAIREWVREGYTLTDAKAE